MNNHINRIHYRIMSRKNPQDTECCKNILPYAICALGASAITAGIIASCSMSHKKYICSPKKW